MNLIRPLAGAVLFALLLVPGAALAESVIDITPGGGHADIAPPSGGGGRDGDSGAAGTRPTDTGPAADTPRTGGYSADSGSGDSDAAAAPELDIQPGLQTRHFGALASVSCKVAAHATDLVVVNQGSEPLPPGTRIKWQLRDRNERGYFAIIGELGAGKSLVADNVLKGRAAQGDACVARVI